MEAVPKLPALAFPPKEAINTPAFAKPLKKVCQFIDEQIIAYESFSYILSNLDISYMYIFLICTLGHEKLFVW